ncbi:MAG: replication factor C large subunit [Candidatus Woesearchaeota archaeon]
MLIKKYIPKKLNDIVGQYSGIVKLSRFIKSKSKKASIIYGETGIGKSLAVRVFATENNFELFELPPSSTRKGEKILEKLRPITTQPSLFGGDKIILIDELESFSSSDRGGIKALIEIIKNTKYPIIITANDPWNSKYKTLRNYCELIQFNPVDYKEIEKYLSKICTKEEVKVEPVVLKRIAARAQGDVRSALMDLEVIINDKTEIENKDIYDLFRERDESIFYSVKITLKSFDSKLALSIFNDIKVDNSEYILWIDQNIHQEYFDKYSLREAYVSISDSDIFNSRISKNQNYNLAKYRDIFSTSGVQQAKKEVSQTISSYKRPELLMKIYSYASKRKKAKGISDQISKKLHTSANALMKDFYPYFDFIKQNNKQMGKELTKYLESEN